MSGNIARLFAQHRSTPERVLYRHHVGTAWADVTVAEVARTAGRWQAAFRREGFVAGDRIALCVRNGVSWVAIDLAALGMGLVVVPLYVDDNPDNVAWCVAHAQARLLIVDNSRIAAGIARLADADHPLPPLVVLRPDDGETARTAAAFLPADGGDFDHRRRSARGAGDDLLHVRDLRASARRDAVARQHPRERRAVPRDRNGEARRPLPVDPAAVAHVRAHRRLLPAARDRGAGSRIAAASRTWPRTRGRRRRP